MIGRIFENFILNRSETGSFYTPCEIVDYMVKESLLELLSQKFRIQNFDTANFLDLTKQSDYQINQFLLKYPKQKILYYNHLLDAKISISVYSLAKIRGYILDFKNYSFHLGNRHPEINQFVWQKFLENDYAILDFFVAKSKKVDSYTLPKIGMVIQIDDQKFVAIFSISFGGYLILDTLFEPRDKKLQKLLKLSQQNLQDFYNQINNYPGLLEVSKEFFESLIGQQLIKNTPQGGVENADGETRSSKNPPLIVTEHRWLRDKFSNFHQHYINIIHKKEILVKYGERDKLYNFIQNLIISKKITDEQKTKQKVIDYLNSLKSFDPACGSGAFPIGVLQQMVDLYHYLGDNRSNYEIKKQILQNSIYGADLLSIAVEISRLRCWLSLVVDEENNNPQALPNLEFKFVSSNSLVGIKEADGLEDPEIPLLRQKLEEIRERTFEPGVDKKQFQEEWKETSKKLFESQLRAGFYDKNSTDLTDWNPFENNPSSFFDPVWMFGVDGFDLVVGNPPYIQLQKNGGELGKLY